MNSLNHGRGVLLQGGEPGRAQASPRVLLALLLLVLAPLIAIAAAPQWWTDLQVLDSSATANDYAAINQGQLKNLATKAYVHLQANLPTNVWITPSGTNLSALINSFQPNSPYNYSAVNLGQLKTVAKPFYDVLNSVGYTNTAVASPYPWSGLESSANDYAMANIGQAKNLFSFDLANFTTEPPLPPGDVTATRNSDGTVEITWSDNSTNETGFTVFRSDDGGATWTAIATTPANITAYTVPAANAGNANSLYQLIAAGAVGNSPPTNPTPSTPPKPAPRYAVIDLGSDHTHVIKIANSGHILAGYGSGGSGGIAGYRWKDGAWSNLTVPSGGNMTSYYVIDMNNSGQIVGSYTQWGQGSSGGDVGVVSNFIINQQGAYWSASNNTAVLRASQQEAYYDFNAWSVAGAPTGPYHYREYYAIDDSGTIYALLDVSSNNPNWPSYPVPLPVLQKIYTYSPSVPSGYTYPDGLASIAGSVVYGPNYKFQGNVLSFIPRDLNNDGALVGESKLYCNGQTQALPATATAINNRHYPPGDTGAPDWQIISSTTLMEKERNPDGTPGATYQSTPITELIPPSLTQTYSAISLTDINDHGVILARAQKNNADHAVFLLPVEITVKKKGTDSAPDDGLVLKKDDVVVIKATSLPKEQTTYLDSHIKWSKRQLKSDGTYTDWTEFGEQKEEFEYTTDIGGIFQVKAVLYDTQEFKLARKKDDQHSSKKKGDADVFGVCDTDIQISLRNTAKAQLGSTAYAAAGSLSIFRDPLQLFSGQNKCNVFVADMCEAAGADVDPPYNGVYLGSPPSANNWAGMPDLNDSTAPHPIPNWILQSDEEKPQPGFVCASGFQTGASGHSGICDYDGQWISAGPINVNRKAEFTGYIRHYYPTGTKPAGMRKYNGN